MAEVERDDLWRTIGDAVGNMVGDFAPYATVDGAVDAIRREYVVTRRYPNRQVKTCPTCNGSGHITEAI